MFHHNNVSNNDDINNKRINSLIIILIITRIRLLSQSVACKINIKIELFYSQ